MRTRAKLAIGAAVLLVLLALAGVLAYRTLLYSEAGARWALDLAAGRLGGTVEYGAVAGTIDGPLTVEDLRYRGDALTLEIERLELDWVPRALLAKQIDVERLEARGVRVVLPPEEEPSEDFELQDLYLPYNVIVRDARVRDLEIRRQGVEEPLLVVDDVVLDSRTRGDAVELRRFTASGPRFRVEASGELTPVGAYPVDLEVSWSAELEGRPPSSASIAGGGRLTGDLENLGVDQRLEEPFAAQVAGRVETPFRAPVLDLAVAVDEVALAEIDPAWPPARVGGTAELRGPLDALRAAADLEVAHPDVGRADVDGSVVLRPGRIEIASLAVDLPGATLVRAEGTVETGGAEPELDLEARWQSLAWPLTGEPRFQSPGGQVSVEGTLSSYRLSGRADVGGATLPRGGVAFAGRGGRGGIDLERLETAILEGQVRARGRLDWEPQVRWRLAVEGRGLDPAAAYPDWPGELAFTGRTVGRVEPGGAVGRVELDALSGELRGREVAGEALVELAGERVVDERLELETGDARLVASGELTDVWDVTYELDVPELAAWVPEGVGVVSASGTVGGPREAPIVAARIEGESLRYGERGASALEATITAGRGSSDPLEIELEARDVVFAPERQAERLALTSSGTVAEHRLELDLRSETGQLAMALAGGVDGEGGLDALIAGDPWRGRLESLWMDQRRAGSWRLVEPAELVAGQEGVRTGELCLLSEPARLCLEAVWDRDGPWRAEGTLDGVRLAVLEPFLPESVELDGDVDGRFLLQASEAARFAARVELQPGPGELRLLSEAGRPVVFPYERGTIRFVTAAEDGRAEIELPLGDLGEIRGQALLPGIVSWPGAAEQPIRGEAEALLRDLAVVEAFFPDLRRPTGTLTADLTIGGTLGSPEMEGSLAVSGGSVRVPAYGLELEDVELQARGDGTGPLALSGSLRSGEGTVEIGGTLTLGPEPRADLTVEGERFLASNLPGQRVVVSPRLELSAAPGEALVVRGEIDVPEADVELGQEGAVEVSDDVVIVGGEDPGAPGAGLPLSVRVRVNFGEEVAFEAAGLTGEIEGSLLITDEPDKPTTAVGRLDIEDGVYQIYGRKLELESGRLTYAGGTLDKPGVDIVAMREAEDGTVARLRVRGTLAAPEVTLTSDRDLGQADTLSYLLLGRPVDQASEPGDGDVLTRAATSLGVAGGQRLARKLGSQFGLEEATIKTGSSLDEASLVLGKYLSPDFYVSYGIGLFDAVNTLRIRYLLDKNWILEAESGETTGADILYTREQ